MLCAILSPHSAHAPYMQLMHANCDHPLQDDVKEAERKNKAAEEDGLTVRRGQRVRALGTIVVDNHLAVSTVPTFVAHDLVQEAEVAERARLD